ncbi:MULTISPECIES: phosphoglycerate dehydrogenase [Oceanospirillaceae]|jgi:D-3-phosphoglycerate dehydrogenase|uniref:phosphoglycerate dehydrogenase n=1 Tax=Oceanospirillaceae TaxID=135620 RepID=UPI000C49C5EA|nr:MULTISPECIES: phosphoglycerate dehydrogenase [Thalassolituus]MAY15281.1 phosphoglycerate dehydrogenase [Oceanospirillaceae bacterium]PIQ39087.1 MAG: phosphoglycerate dehydrogenase [Thalassolituus sp. CG17_big_fil_post_rev_8_21_14_2_50_53_8]MCA6060549.1 phosphoglycerate dehydrogenase [Thalassolituus sp. ST750PaO-4]MCB2386292.1 phosphoglycerate dehydrogenase [Thalassolituus alkanivorans]MCB2424277.1 phosphoglycerate dehydrogenase [Thalassolituus alkanivorans]
MAQTSLDKSKIKFLLLEGVHQSALETLNAAGYTNIEYLKTSLPDDELKARIKDAHFVGIRSRTQLTDEIFEAAEKLIAVGCFCIGTNQVDLKAATKRGVAVFNAPYSNTRSVAELSLAEIIMLMRGIPERNAQCHRGGWNKSADNSYEIRGKKLGIIGYGSIGTQLSVMAESMGMDVYFYDVVTKLPLGNAKQVGSLNELLNLADVVSLHVPETAATKWMMGPEQFAQMKQGSILLNASRGTVVDIDALAEAIRSKKLLGAAIDVFPVEPRANGEEFITPLREFDNVILTPHVGGSTLEAQENIGKEVGEKLAQYSDNGTTTSSVNFPEVALPGNKNVHRILHIHQNVPGVMNAINSIFAENGINISGQYLQTVEEVGYVVIDVAADASELALEKIKTVEGTIRARVLY